MLQSFVCFTGHVVDYQQPLFFRSPSSVKQKENDRAKLETRRLSPRPQFSRGHVFFASRSTDCEKIGAARSLDMWQQRVTGSKSQHFTHSGECLFDNGA